VLDEPPENRRVASAETPSRAVISAPVTPSAVQRIGYARRTSWAGAVAAATIDDGGARYGT
jgi:hypothetical protein